MISSTKKVSDFDMLEKEKITSNQINEYSTIKYRYVVISLILVITGIFSVLTIPSVDQRIYQILLGIFGLILLFAGLIIPLKVKKIIKSNSAIY